MATRSHRSRPAVVTSGAVCVGLLMTASLDPAYATCQHPPTKWAYDQKLSQTWYSDGDICTDIANFPQSIAEIKITARPKHGVAGKNGPFGVAYRPDAGFKGTDSFGYVVISNAGYRGGAGRRADVTITVVVQ
jgi:hypothetical protein